MPFDRYTLLAALLMLSLFATLRLTLPRLFQRWDNAALRLLSHTVWLLPLLLFVYLAVGMYLMGKLSPWPPAAYAAYAAQLGPWAGASAFLVVLITDCWLLWTPTQVLRRFAPPERQGAFKYFQVFNLLVGCAIFALALK